ncbi:TPA: hypothetical protein RG395_002376 [Legionella pneumophila]|nr:hypothetical protein [Legionella pneumophila]MDW8878737.1 hypothetical protein [Legionella pneumophila subsp. fraseri]MDW8962948.1 hypothetical protein [Legionella pneumophila subsp. fraseri]MDW9035461.1 hypothetical protein [Legionella pneumophila subsp. fraseri]MDW9038522.1 hypothetical protein [Legionella pneumophila subsp. fraseri]MDW9041583.1 hypothetical protein [Legionella pneumophila subsp. fraseri]
MLTKNKMEKDKPGLNDYVPRDETRISRNPAMEREMLFFSTLSKRMRENPTQSNFEALTQSDETITEMVSKSRSPR